MPVKITKTDGKHRVSTPGGVKAKGTTKAKAEAQRRLLNAIEHNPNFVPRKSKKKRKKKQKNTRIGASLF